jgi:hypothetical protein
MTASSRIRARTGILRLTMAGLALTGPGCSMATPFGSIYTMAANGGPNYLAGRASQVFPATETFVTDARGALEDVNVRAVVQRNEAGTIVLEGRAPNGHRAHVRLQPESEGRKMHVFARFGTFGDEALSRGFLERLAARVNGLPGDLKEDAAPASQPLTPKASAADPGGTMLQRRLEGRGQTELPFQ